MTVQELIKELQKFPKDMRVVDSGMGDIEDVRESLWVHGNYPYDKPDEEVVQMI